MRRCDWLSVCLLCTDALFRSRSGQDHEATVMIKTQFMIFWDGLITDSRCQILIMGATNRPDDVDTAILRRMPCKFHIGLPVRMSYIAFTLIQILSLSGFL